MRLAPATAAFVLALAPESAGAASGETACPRPARTSATGLLVTEKIRWRASRSLGTPSAGRLVRGVRLPREGLHFFTWDPIRKRSPNRARRRWGNGELVRVVLRVAAGFAARHPLAPRIGVGDLSRPRGGDFGPLPYDRRRTGSMWELRHRRSQ